MIESNKRRSTKTATNNLPCRHCMNYMANDIKFHPSPNINNEREILYYLEHIKDPKVSEIITDLLKSIACL